MKKILVFSLFFQFLFVEVGFAQTFNNYNNSQPLQFENIHITDNLTDLGAEIYFECEETDQKLYGQVDQCLAVCENCTYQDNGCLRCVDSDEDKKDKEKSPTNDSWFQQVKNWVKQIFINIGNFVKNVFNKKEEAKINKKAIAAKKVIEYHKAKSDESIEKPTDESVDDALFHAFKNAKDFAELLQLQSLMMIYCSDMAKQDYEKEKKCNERFMTLFKEKGDEFKEKLIADIDPKKGDGENIQKMVQLESLLMAGESASGKGVWFSTDNIAKVKKQLNEKAKVWFNVVLEKASLERAIELHSLAMVYTSGQGKGTGIMEGINPLDLVRNRFEVLILKGLVKLDICDPDKKELEKIQDLLYLRKLIKDDLVRMYIKEGDTESAYARLYEIVIKKYPEKKSELPIPVDCEKTEENQQETKEPEDENIGTEEGIEIIDEETESQVDENIETEEDVETIDEEISDENIQETQNCSLEVYQKELVGWDFVINNCERSYSEGLTCFNHCGWLPPVYLEETEVKTICYETEEGFVDKDTVISCHKRPEPDPGVVQCINDCLNQ